MKCPDAPGGMVHLEGLDAIKKKADWWEEQMEIHSTKGVAMVAEDWFVVKWTMDMTNKAAGERSTGEEFGVYEVRDGKIVSERFFYHMDK